MQCKTAPDLSGPCDIPEKLGDDNVNGNAGTQIPKGFNNCTGANETHKPPLDLNVAIIFVSPQNNASEKSKLGRVTVCCRRRRPETGGWWLTGPRTCVERK